ncbi:c-type cytochrome [Colwelliaceae bacterium BS250]
MKYLIFCFMSLVFIGLVSCDRGVDSPRGFNLPEGNVTNGKLVFTKYDCSSCHMLKGFTQPDNPQFSVKLGGNTTQIKTYAELVTSVINPSHKFSRQYSLSIYKDGEHSKMTVYNDVMTVTELVDLVEFLQPQYKLVVPSRDGYRHYGY